MLNNNQVKALFEKEAILIGSKDAVPAYRAAELFGAAAAEFVEHLGSNGTYRNRYTAGEYTLPYLNFKGFQAAATYQNIEEIRKAGISEP